MKKGYRILILGITIFFILPSATYTKAEGGFASKEVALVEEAVVIIVMEHHDVEAILLLSKSSILIFAIHFLVHGSVDLHSLKYHL